MVIVTPVVIAEIEEIKLARLAVQFALPRDAMVSMPLFAVVAERLNPSEAHKTDSIHKVEPLGPEFVESFQVRVREEPADPYACHVPRLDYTREPALHWAVLLWRIRRRQLAANSETVTVLHERRIGVLGPVIRPEHSRNYHVCHKPLHHTEDGRCALVPGPVRALEAGSAVHEHDDVSRASQ